MANDSGMFTVDFVLEARENFSINYKCLLDGRSGCLSLGDLTDGVLLLERWTIKLDENRKGEEGPELSELYKRIIVIIRCVHLMTRQLTTHCLLNQIKRLGPYRKAPFSLRLHYNSPSPTEWQSIKGTEHLEPYGSISLQPIMTAHGKLSISVQYRNQISFQLGEGFESIASLRESFEDIQKMTSPRTSTSSRATSFGSSPLVSPKASLGRGQRVSQSIIPKSLPSSSMGRRRNTFPDLPVPAHDVDVRPAVLFQSPKGRLLATSPAGSEETTITQFMKQCENRPFLESLMKSKMQNTNLESELRKKISQLQESFSENIEMWLSDFRAAESLSGALPTPHQRARSNSSLETSFYAEKSYPSVSPVTETHTPSPSSSETGSQEDFKLMFPL